MGQNKERMEHAVFEENVKGNMFQQYHEGRGASNNNTLGATPRKVIQKKSMRDFIFC